MRYHSVMSTNNPDGVSADDHPLRVYAESCILHILGQLHGEALRRLHEVDERTMKFGDGWLDAFLGGFSIPASYFELIPQQWEKERAKNPELTPVEFARQWAGPIFSGHVASLD